MSEEDDRRAWEAEEERKRQEAEQSQSREGIEPLAITVGAAIPANTTIDALFAALYATRSADLVAAGTPTYSWASDRMIIAQWPALQTVATPGTPNYSAMFCTFHARGVRGSSIAQ